MSLDDARAHLSAAQDAVVRALLADSEPPDGIDPGALARARQKLAAKRAWVAERRARRASSVSEVAGQNVWRRLVRWLRASWRSTDRSRAG